MEKRINTRYIITIAAILTFLGMQVYWLYRRYEASLGEQENKILSAHKVIKENRFHYNNDL